MSVFLSIPVQGIRLGHQRYEHIVEYLLARDILITNPQVMHPPSAPEITNYSPQQVYQDIVLRLESSSRAVVEASSPSLGVGYEIARLLELGIPTLCLIRRDAWDVSSLMIRGIKDTNFKLACYETLAEIDQCLDEFLGRDQSQVTARKNLIQEHFAEISSVYNKSTPWRSNYEILKWFKDNTDYPDVLDLGTGTGIVGGYIKKELGCNVTGIDFTSELKSIAEKKIDRFVLGDMEDLPFPNDSFSTVCARQVLHYTDDRSVLSEVFRVVKPGGVFLSAHISGRSTATSIWWREVKQIVQPLRLRYYSDKLLEKLVGEGGFDVVEKRDLELERFDSWDKFFLNCESLSAQKQVRQFIADTPLPLKEELGLIVDDQGIRYSQWWTLLIARKN